MHNFEEQAMKDYIVQRRDNYYISEYPMGSSYMEVKSGDGWPYDIFGSVVTYKKGEDSGDGFQQLTTMDSRLEIRQWNISGTTPYDNFADDDIDEQRWSTSATNGSTIVEENGLMKLTTPYRPSQVANVSLTSDFEMGAGDWEFIVNFSGWRRGDGELWCTLKSRLTGYKVMALLLDQDQFYLYTYNSSGSVTSGGWKSPCSFNSTVDDVNLKFTRISGDVKLHSKIRKNY